MIRDDPLHWHNPESPLLTQAPFDFHPRTRMVFGAGAVGNLGELASRLGAKRAMVVSDRGIVASGHTQKGIDSLRSAGLEAILFDRVHENPSTTDVDIGVAFAREVQPDLLVGLGGGSSMDCAKGVNFVFTNGGQMRDYWGVGKATKPMLPMIAVPTTAGTGSETQSFALISDAETHAKMACGDPKAACAIAILDPELTLTMPRRVTALTGIDAISHAIETFVTTKRNAISLAFSREAWRLLSSSFSNSLSHPGDVESRGAMLLGASLAGAAIENSMLGATHALANPLTSDYGLVHGEAIAVMLPHVIRFNAETSSGLYDEFADMIPFHNMAKFDPSLPKSEKLARLVEALVELAELPRRLSNFGVQTEKLETLANGAAKQWTGTFNPRPVNAECLLELYRKAM